MSDEILYVVGGIVIGLLVFTIAYRLLTISINQAQKQDAIADFNKLYSYIKSVCLQELDNTMTLKLEIPNIVRIIYSTDNPDSPPVTVVDMIKASYNTTGKNICFQFKLEQEARCSEVPCNTSFPVMGALETYNDLQLMVNKILGKPLTKEYSLTITKTDFGINITKS